MWNLGRVISQRNYLIFNTDTIGNLIMDGNNFSSSLVPFSAPLFALFELRPLLSWLPSHNLDTLPSFVQQSS